MSVIDRVHQWASRHTRLRFGLGRIGNDDMRIYLRIGWGEDIRCVPFEVGFVWVYFYAYRTPLALRGGSLD